MGGHLLMSRRELKRKSILELVKNKHITLVDASGRMQLSYRQTLRIYNRFCLEGDSGLIHGLRGKQSNRGHSLSFRKKVIARYKIRYQPHEVGPTLAAEKLADDGFDVDHETLRRWLCAEGLWYKKRKKRVHRTRRERRHHFGELVQMDGSHHNWFGRDYGKACLMNMVDDATGKTLASMDKQETTKAAMIILWRWIDKYGIPVALYTDKKNVYLTTREPTIEEQLAGQEPRTAFGEACEKLGIDIIAAHSPQAKGRVERSNGTYQDRLVKELALRYITTCTTTDRLLQNGFCDDLNTKFAVKPLDKKDFHRPVPKGTLLENIFCFEALRVVQNDWVISHESTYYQITEDNKPLPRPKDKILVRTLLDGSVHLIYKGKELNFQPLKKQELRTRAQKPITKLPPKKPRAHMPQKGHKPATNHPWAGKGK